MSNDNKVAAAFFMGQGGLLFSSPFAAIGEIAKEKRITVGIYTYSDWSGEQWLRTMSKQGYKIVAVGYSLGVTMATYLQTIMKMDLVISVAASTLGENHPINRANCKRSRLFYGTDFLSSAGRHDGYDETTPVTAAFGVPVLSHLGIPTNPIVINGILGELAALQKGQ